MKITKLEHSGIIIEKDGKRIVFDPVEFEAKIPQIENVVAVVITHNHSDHLQIETLKKILSSNSEAKVFTTADTAPMIGDVAVVKAGDNVEIGGFRLDFFGKDHACIIPGQVPCENIGAVVDGAIVHPGDSFDLPNIQANVLLVPISAPWLKTAESMDYIAKAKPKIVVPIHEAVLSDLGKTFSNNLLKRACDGVGAEYKILGINKESVF